MIGTGPLAPRGTIITSPPGLTTNRFPDEGRILTSGATVSATGPNNSPRMANPGALSMLTALPSAKRRPISVFPHELPTVSASDVNGFGAGALSEAPVQGCAGAATSAGIDEKSIGGPLNGWCVQFPKM